MKKYLSFVLILALCLCLWLPACATSGTEEASITYRAIKVIINGREIAPCDSAGNPTEPFIMGGSTYLPLRAVAGSLGLGAAWDGPTNTVSLTSGAEPVYGSGTPAASRETRTEKITYRNIKIILDGVEIVTSAEPFIMGGSTYLPLRAVASALGLEVAWDGASSTVTLTGGETSPAETVLRPAKVTSVGSVDGETVFTETNIFSYDSAGRLTALTSTGSGSELRYSLSYYSTGELQSIVRENLTEGYLSEEHFDIQGNLSRSRNVLPDGVDESLVYANTYDSAGRLERTEVSAEGSNYWSKTLYSYDEAGRLAMESLSDSAGSRHSITYSYDDAGRLVKAHKETDILAGGYETTAYSYDSAGNLIMEEYRTSYGAYYRWSCSRDGEGRALSGRLVETGADTVDMVWSYDGEGRAVELEQSSGGTLLVSTAEYAEVPEAEMHEAVAELLRSYGIEA